MNHLPDITQKVEAPPPNATYILGYSGGKDSTAALIYLIKEKQIPPDQLKVIFLDTGNEAAETYMQVRYLHKLIKSWGYNEGIISLCNDTFLRLCTAYGFPIPRSRFCTERLKIVPKIRWILDQEFENPISVTGIRREESAARSNKQEWEEDRKVHGLLEWNPIITWTHADVFNIHKKYGVIPHTFYSKGFSRVGCFPCIYSRKMEIRLLADLFPWRIAEIDHWEEVTGHTYFPPRKEGVINKIHDVVLWSRNGQDANLFPDEKSCAYAGLGVCE